MGSKKDFNATLIKAEKLFYFAMTFLFLAQLGVLTDLRNQRLHLKEQEVALATEEDEDRIVNGIHVQTGLIDAKGMRTVINNCTNCHSAKLVTQNRMDAESWNTTIKWMQDTQNLWELGENQKVIVNYLVANYPLLKKGRRDILKNIEWYELEN